MPDRPTSRNFVDMMYGEHMGAGGWILSVLLTLLVVALIVVGIVWLVRSVAAGTPAQVADQPRESPRELLDRRLAAGEISEEEYRSLRAAVRDEPRAAAPT
jgi:putative membrane protein